MFYKLSQMNAHEDQKMSKEISKSFHTSVVSALYGLIVWKLYDFYLVVKMTIP